MRLIDADDVDNHIVGSVNLSGCPTINAIPIPEYASNGDVIKAMFPKEEIEEHKDTFGIVFERAERFAIFDATFSKAWWNAKYKGVK